MITHACCAFPIWQSTWRSCAINVGGHGAVTMEDLKKAFEACAFKDVKTIATSGNVAFSAPMAEAAVVKTWCPPR